MNPIRRAGLVGLLGFSVVAGGGEVRAGRAPRQQDALFRAGVELVQAGVVVTDRRGRIVTDLTVDDFTILEDGVAQTVEYFAAGDGPVTPPLHLGLLLDVSESMGAEIDFTRAAAIKFLNALQDAADITLVDFDAQVRAARFTQGDFPRLVERIRQQRVRGFTALYDAIGLYLDGAASQDGRTIMLLYTDGIDTRSALRVGELMDLLKLSDVTIYVVGALEAHTSLSRPKARLRLMQIAETTGGQAFFPTVLKDLDKTYAQVLAEVRGQYTLGYRSANHARDGAWRTLAIKVRRPDVRIRARPGYFAAGVRR